jgi:nitrogen fixation/metabolism regulation signal transduction histidine kinase
VLLFGLLAAVLAAFGTAQRLVAPVADIARGTRAVADGDYEQQLPLPSQDDELAFLVASFNAMTRRIAQARDQRRRASARWRSSGPISKPCSGACRAGSSPSPTTLGS